MKKTCYLGAILTAVLILLASTHAFAGLIIEGQYSSTLGYKIRPPQNWVKLDRSTYHGLKDNLPSNLKQIDLERVDAVFYLDTRPEPKALDAGDAQEQDQVQDPAPDYFADSLSIMAVRNVPSIISKEIAVSLAEESIKRLESSSGSYPELSKTEADVNNSITGRPFVLRLRYKLPNDIVVNTRHYVFAFSGYTLILSCTFQSISGSNSATLCGEAVESIVFKDGTL
ncbi:MAG: hypothetical protein WC966_09285 [Bradymonadales bacterium]